MARDREDLARRPGRVRFSGPVTLRRGVTRTIEGARYTSGEHYAPDDPGVLAQPHHFILVTPSKEERTRFQRRDQSLSVEQAAAALGVDLDDVAEEDDAEE